jgi:cytoskeleton protein RodZ
MKSDFPGHLLRNRRNELGLSTEDVFRKTRIPTEFIEALEGGDLDVLPSSCFSVGFIKSYCRLIDVDANYYVDAYGAAAQPPVRRFSLKDYKRLTTPRSMAGELIMWAAICAVLVVAWTVYSVVVRPTTEAGQGSVQAGALMIESDTAVGEPGH